MSGSGDGCCPQAEADRSNIIANTMRFFISIYFDCEVPIVCQLSANAVWNGIDRNIVMAISEHLQRRIQKKYEPSSLVSFTYKGNDIMLKTDAEGNGVLMFIGKRTRNGKIKGSRYSRRLVVNKDGIVIKDHWEMKGKATDASGFDN